MLLSVEKFNVIGFLITTDSACTYCNSASA